MKTQSTLKKFKVWLISGGFITVEAESKYLIREELGSNFKLAVRA